jgi:hypothetical protein
MENIIPIYIHIDPTDLPFSDELDLSNFTYSNVPEYTYVSIEQTKKITGIDSVLLTNKDFYIFKDEIHDFYNTCKYGFPSFYKDSFWLLTFLRMYIVFLYVKHNNIDKFVHLENDNLIYDTFNVFKKLPSGCFFTKVGPHCGSSGLMYCNDIQKFNNVINKMLVLIKKGEQVVRTYTSYDFLSEMILIDLLVQANIAEYLPLFPDDKYFELTNTVFDGASYGQYIGGTNNGHGPGWYGQNHYVGQKINDKILNINFNVKKPNIVYSNKEASIYNLHIHSKKLAQYV